MLSVLIPIYNFRVVHLVQELLEQSQQLSMPIEIICIDDASKSEFHIRNQNLVAMDSVRYEVLKKNIGRSAIRNKLAHRATYPYLLFLDCDGACPDSDFLKRYIATLSTADVICGGRIYGPKPSQSDLMLHWKYGSQREVRAVNERKAQPGYSFMTNNFAISAKIFETIKFNESLVQYGHEDTLFGLELLAQNATIAHIDNPLIHIGLEPAGKYLEKAREAAENLAVLVSQGKVGEQIRLVRVYQKLKRSKLLYPVDWMARIFGIMIRRNLRSRSPSLRLFDWYRLHYFIRALKDV